MTLSEPFDIARGVIKGDILSPVAFIAGLDRIFRMHDLQNPGVAVGVSGSTTIMSKFEYADDAALVDADAAIATARVTALAAGSLTDAAIVISQAKSKVMHRKTRVSSTTDAEDEASTPTQRGLHIHAARWCDGGVKQRSRRGSVADRDVQTAARRAPGALLSHVDVGNTPLENVYSFEYLEASMQWHTHLKPRSLSQWCAVWTVLTVTGQGYRVTPPAPEYDLLLLRFNSAASVTSAISYACPRVGWCDAPWHSLFRDF